MIRDLLRTRANAWSHMAYVVGLDSISPGWHDFRQRKD